MSKIPHVVILGGGFGGLSAANEIRNSLDSSKVNITIIDKKDWFMVGYAKLWIMNGSRTFENSIGSLQELPKKQISFLKDEIIEIDTKNNFVKKGSSFRNSGTNLRTKNTSSPGRGGFLKPSFVTKSHPITNDFERRKLAEQRATKRIKGDGDNRKFKSGQKKRETKLTVSRALSDEIEARERSLASVKRAREKEQKNLNKDENKENLKPIKRDIKIPEAITGKLLKYLYS